MHANVKGNCAQCYKGFKSIWTEDIASRFEVGGGRGGRGAKIKMLILIFSLTEGFRV